MKQEETYCRILQVSKEASLEEIKKAYRKRARELHPDVNKAGSAHEDFILLNEAYEYLSGKLTGKRYNEQKETFEKAGGSVPYDEAWLRKQREEARRRATAHAAMEYEKFRSTAFYKNITRAEQVLFHVQLVFFSVIVFVVPVVATLIEGWKGLIGSLIVIIITSQLWVPLFRAFIALRKSRT